MQHALVLTYNKIPNDDAGAIRQIVFSKMLKELGYEVFIIGMGVYTENKINTIDGISYVSFRNKGNSLNNRVDNYFGYKKRLKKFLKNSKNFSLILVIDLPLNAMRYAAMYAKKNKSILLHDSVEWYSPEEFKWKWLSIEYLRKNYKNKYFFNKQWKIIAISSFLEQHFKGKGISTIRIPAVMNMQEVQFSKKCNTDKTVIVYAGAPGKKDCFDQIILALESLDEEILSKVEFRVIGVDEESFRLSMNISRERWNELKKVVNCLGRVSRDIVLNNLREADYTILLRQAHLRYAKAGFSTKVPESLLTGTPVICNFSSDLDMYLRDGQNAIIVKNNISKSIKDALERAINMPYEQRKKMQEKSFETAHKFFDYHVYIKNLSDLINKEDYC